MNLNILYFTNFIIGLFSKSCKSKASVQVKRFRMVNTQG